VIEGTEFETSLIESGESETITVNLPAGEYTFFCPVPGHQQAGMEGTLIVSDDGSTTVSPDNDTDEPDNTGDEDGNGPGEDTPINPREDPADGSSPPTLGGVHALILQPTTAPDEVVISLTDAGFTPDTFDLARGGTLVIENAGETGCEVTFTDLDVSVELDAGDIEQVTLDIPAGAYDLACIAQGDEVLGEAVVTIVEETAQDEPIEDATPEPAAEATPTPDVTEDPVADDVAAAGPMGLLMQTSVTLGGASELFAATLTLQPGGVLPLISADGMLGMMVTGGDLTVVRPGRAAAVLRDGRTAILPSGTIAEMTNNGDAPLTVLIAGVTGSSAAPDSEATNTPVSDDSGDDDASSDDTGSTDTGSASLDHYAFFPDDSELAELGLYPTWVAYTEISDPASNTFWLSGENSEASLTDWGWIRSSELRYSSEGEVTEYGEVSVMGILVDSFEDEDGAASFYAYIAEDTTGEPVDFLDGIDEVEDAIAFTFSGAASDTMIVAIQTGTYVITLFAAGPGIDAEALLDDVASLVFGVVG
jgi:plastocyanin/quercetin dioxygenase-like cupin family protein